MDKKLSEPMNHRNLPWGVVLLGLLGFLSLFLPYTSEPPEYFVDVIGPVDAILTSLGFICSYTCLMLGLWAALRINLFHADHDEFNLSNAIIPAFFGAFFYIAPIIIYDVVILEACTLTVTKLAAMLGFGLIISLLDEQLIIIIIKDYQLQKQALEKLALNQEMTFKEVAAIANMSEDKVQRALGYQTRVPASVVREWLENVKGIRCPPAKKVLA